LVEDTCLMLDFIRHGILRYRALGWPVALAIGLSVPIASFTIGLVVVIGLPADYFVRARERSVFWQSSRALRLAFVMAKNLLGAIVFLAGFVMALPLVPGPGVLLMLVGVGLVDFPGKRTLERRFLREPHLLSSVNRMRARFGKPPIVT
jgi:hypothetical protein